MYVDDIKLFAKMKKKNGNSQTRSQDIWTEFGMEKCAMQVMKSGKRHLRDGTELPNQDKIKKRRQGNIQILGYLGG